MPPKEAEATVTLITWGIYTMEDEFLFYLGRFTKWFPRKDESLYITEYAKLQSQFHVISSS
jgi:hypothetical protein